MSATVQLGALLEKPLGEPIVYILLPQS